MSRSKTCENERASDVFVIESLSPPSSTDGQFPYLALPRCTPIVMLLAWYLEIPLAQLHHQTILILYLDYASAQRKPTFPDNDRKPTSPDEDDIRGTR
jgi:hypothetical protein